MGDYIGECYRGIGATKGNARSLDYGTYGGDCQDHCLFSGEGPY